MLDISEFPATNLKDAFFILDDRRVLNPGSDEYNKLYVERPVVGGGIIERAIRTFTKAAQQNHDFQLYVTGHTGSGKSTELRRILNTETVQRNFHQVTIDIINEFDPRDLDYLDFILVMARSVIKIAEETDCKIPDNLVNQINNWNKEITEENITYTGTTGLAKLFLTLPFISASEEIKSGADKRKIVRETVQTNLSQFIQWIDQTAAILLEKTKKRVLCVIDGLDHLDTTTVFNVLYPHNEILTKPALAQLWVIPIPLLYTNFGHVIRGKHAAIHNIPVYQNCHERYQVLSDQGFAFFEDLIYRYCAPELFEEGVLKCLFELSAGHMRDMIRACSEACGYAMDRGAEKIAHNHVKEVWYAERRIFTNLMTGEDYDILRRVDGDPQLVQGQKDLAHLIHRKALIFFPNGDGWYSLHPALKQKMDGNQPDCQKYV